MAGKVKTPSQLQTSGKARASQVEWVRKATFLDLDLFRVKSDDEWIHKTQFLRSLAAFKESPNSNAGSQSKCVLYFLWICCHSKWIEPCNFQKPDDISFFYGWYGFRVTKSSFFKPAVQWLFSLPGGRKCKPSTIQNFFITKANNMKPTSGRWEDWYNGSVPIIICVGDVRGAAANFQATNPGFESTINSTAHTLNPFPKCFSLGGLDKYMNGLLEIPVNNFSSSSASGDEATSSSWHLPDDHGTQLTLESLRQQLSSPVARAALADWNCEDDVYAFPLKPYPRKDEIPVGGNNDFEGDESALTPDSPHEAQRIGLLAMQTFNFSRDLLLRVHGRIKAEEAAGGTASDSEELAVPANCTMLGCDLEGPAAEMLWAEEQDCDGRTPLNEPPAFVHGDGAVCVEESGLWVDVAGDWEEAELAGAEGGASPGVLGMHEIMEPCRLEIPRAQVFAEPQVSLQPPVAPPPAGRRKRGVGVAERQDGSGKRGRREDMHGTR